MGQSGGQHGQRGVNSPAALTRPRLHAAFCRTLADQPAAAEWQALTPADWQAAPSVAREQGLAPLLYHKLGMLTLAEGISPAARQRLEELRTSLAGDYYASSAQNQLLYAEFGRALKALAAANIPALALKGAILAATLYDDIALRPMNDLDLLVRRADLEAAAQVIVALGYQPVYPEHLGLAGWVDAELNHHLHLRGGATQSLALELHWSLVAGTADARSPRLEWFWQEAVPLTLPAHLLYGAGAGDRDQALVSARGLSPTANLIYLAAHLLLQHGAYHAIWLWYYDLYLLIQRCGKAIRWEELPQIAAELRCADALRLALQTVQEWFGASLPPGLLANLEERSDPRLARRIAVNARAAGLRTLNTWQALQLLDLPTRLRLILALLFPRPQYLRWRYRPQPSWIWPACYPWRWLDIAGDGLQTLVNQLNRRRLEKNR